MAKMRFHKGADGWGRDSYEIPPTAVAGASDCGTCSDSPAPSDKVTDELQGLINFLRGRGIQARLGRSTQSGNIFMGKRWVCVPRKDLAQGTKLADQYREAHERDTRWIHDAN